MIRHVSDCASVSYYWSCTDGTPYYCWLRINTGRKIRLTAKKLCPQTGRIPELQKAYFDALHELCEIRRKRVLLPDDVPGLGPPPFAASREFYKDWFQRCEAYRLRCIEEEKSREEDEVAAQRAIEDELARLMPFPELYIYDYDGRHYAILHNHAWTSKCSLTEDEWRLLIAQKLAREEAKLAAALTPQVSRKRESIPDSVRIAVWRRDEGKCVRCSSRERLEFDHIIPVSLGGSSTVRNLQLLCEPCNRSKSQSIA